MAELRVEPAAELSEADLADLCDATEIAILDGGGFGWLTPPPRSTLERYWKGVLLIPERSLLVGRLDGTIGGSAQLVRPARNNEAQAFAATITTNFVAPWARGNGMARDLTVAVEEMARDEGFLYLTLDVRETQSAALQLYQSLDYERWGSNPNYAFVDGAMIAGHYYAKRLNAGLPDGSRRRPGGNA